jgi:hypothetical protein
MRLLQRVQDALIRLPDSALGPYYYQIPGDRLASPRLRPVVTDHPRSPGQRTPTTGEAAP